MSTANTSTDTKTGAKSKKETVAEFDSEEMFRNAKKGDILVADKKEHLIVSTGPGKYGRMISIMHEEVNEVSEKEGEEKSEEKNEEKIEVQLYFKQIYQSLQMFVPDKGWETFPGSTNFKIKSVTK